MMLLCMLMKITKVSCGIELILTMANKGRMKTMIKIYLKRWLICEIFCTSCFVIVCFSRVDLTFNSYDVSIYGK